MKSRSVLMVALFVRVCLGQEENRPASERIARVRVAVSTSFGVSLDKAQVTLKTGNPPEQRTKTGEVVEFENVPFGLYNLEVQRAGFSTLRQQIGIYQADLSFRIGLAVSPTHGSPPSEIIGSIDGVDGVRSRDFWVRLVPIYSDNLLEASIDDNGRFKLSGMLPGSYVLLLFQRNEFVATEKVEYQGGTVTLKLSAPTR